jgi:hypothetical protein
VQEVNSANKINDFVEFFDFDYFRFISTENELIAHAGDNALFAFIDEAGSLVETDSAQITSLIVKNRRDFSQLAVLTRLQLMRVASPRQLFDGEILGEFARKYDLPADITNAVYRGNLKTIQEYSQIWREIDEIPPEIYSDDTDDDAPAALEDLIRLLFSTEIDDTWIRRYTYAMRKIAFDDRLIELGTRLIQDQGQTFLLENAQASKIVSRLVDLSSYYISSSTSSDFIDALIDLIADGSISLSITPDNIYQIAKIIEDANEKEVIKQDVFGIFFDSLFDPSISRSRAVTILSYLEKENDLDSAEFVRRIGSSETYFTGRELLKDVYDSNIRLQVVLDSQTVEQHGLA